MPASDLSPQALTGLLDEFASRDGTDYGLREMTLAEKRDSLQKQLDNGELVLIVDVDLEQWDLVPAEHAPQWLKADNSHG